MKIYKFLLIILTLIIFPTSAYGSSDWRITLKVSGGGIYDYCIAGAKDGATDVLDNAWDIPAPPGSPYNTYIYAYFPHAEWGGVFDKFRQDIKVPDLPKEWTFEVSSNISGELTISWPDIKNAIPDKQAILVDMDGSGSKVNMFITSSFAFVNSGALRKFLVRISEGKPVPKPPESLVGKVDRRGKEVLLYWKRNRELNLAGYNVYRSNIPGGGYQKINNSLISSPKHRYTDKKVIKGETYYYVVTAVSTTGGESGYSNQVEVIISSK